MLKNCLFALLCICWCPARAALPAFNHSPSALFNVSTPAADAIQLDGSLVNGRVAIRWVTDADTAGGFFVLQKSADGKSWQEWQRMGANGRHQYYTTDDGATAGNCWYRIVLTNGTGQDLTSAPLWISGSKKLVSMTVVRSSQSLHLLWWGTGAVTADVQLYYFNGQTAKNYGAVTFTGNYSLPLNDLPAGRYILKFAAGPVVESLSFQY